MTPLETAARMVDLLALAFVFGSTAWFFFVQSAVLLNKLGRERFVPLQMRLTRVLFATLTSALGVLVGASVLHGRGEGAP